MKYVIGNGQSTYLWLNNWHLVGLGIKHMDRGLYDLGRSLMAKVSSITSNGSWRWPRERNSVTQDIIRHPANFIWAEMDPYHFRAGYCYLCFGGSEVCSRWGSLENLAWLPCDDPMWAFITWMDCHGRLPMRDRLARWGVTCEKESLLSTSGSESHESMITFYLNSISLPKLWKHILLKCGVHKPRRSFSEEVAWAAQHCKGGGSASASIHKVAFSASVYYFR